MEAIDISAFWKKLESALKKKEPELKKRLRAPASVSELTQLEALVGTDLPLDFKSSYLVHDGTEPYDNALVPETLLGDPYYMMPISEIMEEWMMMRRLLESGEFTGLSISADEAIQPVCWHLSWIPFLSNGGGDTVCLDMSPTEKGRSGQVIQYNHESGQRRLVAGSFAEFTSVLLCAWTE